MFEGLNYIELSGDSYPYKCDMLVLEKIQEEYQDLSAFENALSGFVPEKNEDGSYKRNEEGYLIGTYEIPNLKILKKALCWMVAEGLAIEREENGEDEPQITERELMRRVDISPMELGKILQEEFGRCFKRKNEKTTQSRKKETKKAE